jgi:hypothetical protein
MFGEPDVDGGLSIKKQGDKALCAIIDHNDKKDGNGWSPAGKDGVLKLLLNIFAIWSAEKRSRKKPKKRSRKE